MNDDRIYDLAESLLQNVLNGVQHLLQGAVEQEKVLSKAGGFVSQIDSNYIERLGLTDCCDRWRNTCGLVVHKTQ